MTRRCYLRWATISIAVVVVLGAGAISLVSSEVVASESSTLQEQAGAGKSAPSRSASRAPTATERARYYIPHVQEVINVNNTFCSSAIIITVPFTAPAGGIKLEVEVFNDIGNTQVLQTVAPVARPGDRYTVITDNEIEEPFVVVDKDLDLTNFTGFAIISASDPRILVTAYDYCREGTGALDDLVSMNAITVYPLGMTLEFLKAGLPEATSQPHLGLLETEND